MPRMVTVLDGAGGVALSLTYGAAAPAALRTLQLLIGSVARYTREGGYELNLVRSADCRVVFRSVGDDDTLLVLVTDDAATLDAVLREQLELVYHGATLLLGPRAFDGVSTQGLQRNLKAATPFIDHLFAHSQPALGVVLRATEMHSTGGQWAHTHVTRALDAAATAAEVDLALVLIKGCVAAATAACAFLPPLDLRLVQTLVSSGADSSTSRDTPVYLPMEPTKAVRLLVVTLCDGVQLALLCGNKPSLELAESLAREHFAPTLSTLQSACHLEQPRWLDGVAVPAGVIACIVVRRGEGESQSEAWMWLQGGFGVGADFRRGLLEAELRTAGAEALRALVALVHLSAAAALALDPTAVTPPTAHLPRHHDATGMQLVTEEWRLVAALEGDVKAWVAFEHTHTSQGAEKTCAELKARIDEVTAVSPR